MEPISKLAEDRLLRKFWPALSTLLLAKKMRIAIHALTLWLVPLIHIATVAAFPHRKHQSPSRRDLFTSRRDSGFLSAGPSNKFYRRSLPTHVFALSRDYWHSPSGQRPKATGSSTSLSSPERSTLVKRGGLRLSRENLQILNDRLSKEAYSQPERPPWESDKIPSYRADRGNSETEGVAVEGKSSRRACVFSLKKKSMQREDCGDKRHGHGLGENRRRRAHASRYHKKDNQRDKRRKSDSQGKKDHISRPRHQYYRKVNSQESGLDRIEPGSPHPADSMNFFSSRPDLAQAATRHHGDLEEDLSNPVVLGLLEKHHSSVRFVPPDEEQAHRRPPLYHPQLHDDSSHIRQKPSRVKDSAEDLMSGDKRTTVPADSKEGKAAEQSANHSGSKEAGEKSPEKKNDGEQSSATKKEDGKRGFYQRLDRVFKWSLLGTVIGVGGSVPAMISAHGYAAQARAQQQSANAATASMIHNGTETPDGEHTTTPNGTTIEIPRNANATKPWPTRRSLDFLASSLWKRAIDVPQLRREINNQTFPTVSPETESLGKREAKRLNG